MSKRQPSRSAVRLIPPTMASPSRTVTGTARLTNSKAAVRPAGPAPMTTTCGLSATMLLNLPSRLHLARDVIARGQPAEAELGCTAHSARHHAARRATCYLRVTDGADS